MRMHMRHVHPSVGTSKQRDELETEIVETKKKRMMEHTAHLTAAVSAVSWFKGKGGYGVSHEQGLWVLHVRRKWARHARKALCVISKLDAVRAVHVACHCAQWREAL